MESIPSPTRPARPCEVPSWRTAVVEIREALAKADRIVDQAIDKQVAAEIDREAALAKASTS